MWILQNWKHEWKNCAAARSVENRRAGECSPAHFVAILSRIYDAFSVG